MKTGNHTADLTIAAQMQAQDDRIAELEAENERLQDALDDDGVLVVEVENKRDTALRDGLRELAEKWRGIVGDPGTNLVRFDCADEMEALIDKEPAPPPATDDEENEDGSE